MLKNIVYNVDDIKKFFKDLLKINNNKVFSIPGRIFLHYATKENIKNGDKNNLKIKSKENAKKEFNIDIYHNLINKKDTTKQLNHCKLIFD